VRSRADFLILAALLACAASSACAASAAGPAGAPGIGAPIAADEVRLAAAKLAADPNLGRDRKIRSLRWTQTRPTRTPDRPTAPPSWLEGLFEYLGQTGSLFLWVAGAIAAAISVIWAYRTFKARDPMPKAAPLPAAARIGDMDIRPESLPDDIGAAALALAEQGKTRDALSLLYRGALSRAVHRFGVPIGESHTEDEALRAIGARLDAPRVSYVADLVAIWRRAVYAGRPISGDPVKRLCRGFAPALDSAAV
jgi:uncharacterized protein DUF4129